MILLTLRFGPTQLVEVYEQALTQLRLGKNQNIRELTQEVQRLVKLAYPDIFGPLRERLAVKHLINAVPDKEAVFYVREKNVTWPSPVNPTTPVADPESGVLVMLPRHAPRPRPCKARSPKR